MLTQMQLRQMSLICENNMLFYTFDNVKFYPACSVIGVDKDVVSILESSLTMHHALFDIIRVLEIVANDLERAGNKQGVVVMDTCTSVAFNSIRAAQYGLRHVAAEFEADLTSKGKS